MSNEACMCVCVPVVPVCVCAHTRVMYCVLVNESLSDSLGIFRPL